MKRSFFSFLTGIFLLAGLVFIFSGCHGDNSSFLSNEPAPPSPVAVLAISAVSGNSAVTLSWSSISSATSYVIYRSDSSAQPGTQIVSVASPSTSFLDSDVANGNTYYYVIDALSGSSVIVRSSQVAATPASPSGSITVSGVVKYQDKEYGLNGFTGVQPYKAVRYATVELVTASGVSSSLTDSNGLYSINTSTTSAAYVRVYAEATLSGAAPQVSVKHVDSSGSMYVVRGNDFIASGSANVNISIPSTVVGGAFNILDVFTNGIQFVHSLSGNYPSEPLSAFWQQNNSQGTYYCTGGCSPGDGIYVYNNPSGDTDEYDDDVLYHEFGHFATAFFSKDDSLGGVHYLTDNNRDLRLTWSEGYSNYFQGAIEAWLSDVSPLLLSTSNPPYTYLDTSGSTGWSIDFGNPDDVHYPNAFFYASSEVAVANVLSRITGSYGSSAVWEITTNFKEVPPAYPVSLELFWDRWRSLRNISFPSEKTALEAIFGARKIYYKEDAYEAFGDDVVSGSSRTVTLPVSEVHYLYKADNTADRDIIRFTANSASQRFTIQTTSSLKNGGDTYVRILNESEVDTGTSNDNWNGVTYSAYCGAMYYPDCPLNGDIYNYLNQFISPAPLSSRVFFTAPEPGQYYVEVTTSSIRPPSTGRYGTYTLTISTP
jgi:hypothetical protein